MKSTYIVALFLATGSLAANAASFPKACVEYGRKLDELASVMPKAAVRLQQGANRNKELFGTLDPESQSLAARALKSSCKRQIQSVNELLEQFNQENLDFHS